MNTDPKKSAMPCGCDEGASYRAPDCRLFHEGLSLAEPTYLLCYCNGRRGHPPGPNCEPGAVICVAPMAPPITDAQKTARWRKERPVYSGVLAYFPDALLEVAHVSFLGNQQHNPGQPLHWAKEKSTDHLDCVGRHLIDHAAGRPTDGDTAKHLAKVAWRALAELQTYLEKESK